jgi:hypothetical protein
MNNAHSYTTKAAREWGIARRAFVKALNNYNATRNTREADALALTAGRFLKATINDRLSRGATDCSFTEGK